MCFAYRLVDHNGEILADGETIGQLKALIRDMDAGRHAVEEISASQGGSATPLAYRLGRNPDHRPVN
jgi:hypothetical protein